MALQSGGTITLRQISNEFGGSDPISMSEYYRNGPYVPTTISGISAYVFDRTTTGNYHYWQDAYWGFQRSVYWGGVQITGNAGYNVTTISSGGSTYYRGSYQTNQVIFFSSGFPVNFYWFSIAQSTTQLVNLQIPTNGIISMSRFYNGRKT